jgi:hypothetical protein
MMTSLIQSGQIGLNAWAPYVNSRATYAQSTVRRFVRWLNNDRLEVHHLYGPLIQQALTDWGAHKLYLALDTSMLWDTYCQVRISVIYRGRSIAKLSGKCRLLTLLIFHSAKECPTANNQNQNNGDKHIIFH